MAAVRLDTQKLTVPDDLSPQLPNSVPMSWLPLSPVLLACLRENSWSSACKKARMIHVHKKTSRSNPQNYQPISLLSVVAKVFVVVGYRDLKNNNLHLDHQYGLKNSRTTSDLLMLLTKGWQYAVDNNLDTVVVALNTASAFDRVWHHLEKLRRKGIQGDLLQLLRDYFQGRILQVVVNGQTAESLPMEASVPQGSVLGPVLRNVHVDDLRRLSAVLAHADDSTLSCGPALTPDKAVSDLRTRLIFFFF